MGRGLFASSSTFLAACPIVFTAKLGRKCANGFAKTKKMDQGGEPMDMFTLNEWRLMEAKNE